MRQGTNIIKPWVIKLVSLALAAYIIYVWPVSIGAHASFTRLFFSNLDIFLQRTTVSAVPCTGNSRAWDGDRGALSGLPGGIKLDKWREMAISSALESILGLFTSTETSVFAFLADSLSAQRLPRLSWFAPPCCGRAPCVSWTLDSLDLEYIEC